MNRFNATVVGNKDVFAPGASHTRGRRILSNRLAWLYCPEIAGEARPGQFVMVKCGGCTLPRPFSIHRVDETGKLALFFAVWEGGRGTMWLSERKEGDKVEMFGPLGNGFSIRHASRRLLLVAGGTGIAPLWFLAGDALQKGCLVTLLYGSHDKSRYPERLLPQGIELIAATEDGSTGYHGMVTDLIPEYAGRADQVFACGPLPMYRTMAQMPELREKAVQASLEVRMGCGLGVCYGCTIRTKKGLREVCQDGPVFELESIVWDELIETRR